MKRDFLIKDGISGNGPVIYWMSRDQRIYWNRALEYAQKLAIKKKKPLEVIFGLSNYFLGATVRHFSFMLKGLEKINSELEKLNIKFTLLKGNVSIVVSNYINEINCDTLIADFDPLKIKKKWKNEVKNLINCPFIEVDAHNIVPVRVASDKEEFAAYTIRPKLHKLLTFYLNEKCELVKHPFGEKVENPKLDYDLNIYEQEPNIVSQFKSGEDEAQKKLKNFLEERANKYHELRNIPTVNYQSDLSPYLHFGQISAEQIVIEVNKSDILEESKKTFIEELFVRRELADNYCFYNENYDNFDGLQNWAKQTLIEHQDDPREYLYSIEEFEYARTHDIYWNAAQLEMVKTGKMHGYMRMYWAKKILEWTKSPEEAIQIAIYLNDKYELDGRDPNGYTGIMWSIGGIHDRPWFERPIFGKIRYMNANGLERKFDVMKYVEKINNIELE